jgi:hypothetical protein
MIHQARFVHHDGMTVFADTLCPEDSTGKSPMVMIHSGGHSGACYLLTADNRVGWAYRVCRTRIPRLVA